MSRSSPSRLVSNTVWNLIGRVSQIFVGLFLTPYLLTNLGQERFGLWALANLLIGYLSLADLGISSSLVRHIAHAQPDENPTEFSRIVSTSFFFYFGVFVLMAPLSLWIGPWLIALLQSFGGQTIPSALLGEASFVVTFVVATLFLSLALAVFSAIPTGLQRMERANQLLIASAIGNLVAFVIAVEGGWGVSGLVVGTMVVKALIAGATYLVSLQLFERIEITPRHFQWRVWKELFSFGWKIQVSRLCEILTYGFDRLFLSFAGGVAELGRYQPAVQASTQTRMLPQFLAMAALPYASDLSARQDRRALLELYLRGTLYVTFASFALMGLVGATAPLLTRLWLGPGYADVGLWIRIFAVAYLFIGPLSLGGLLSQAIGRPGLQARSAFLGTICTVIFSSTGYSLGGITGLATGSATAAIVAASWFFLRLNAALEVPTWTVIRRSFLRPAAYLLLPAVLLAAAIDQVSAESTGGALTILIGAGLLFSGPVLIGMTRLRLWNVHEQLASTAPSTEHAGLPPR